MKKKKANVKGQCNICGEFRKLSQDHTPPKGCGNISAVEIGYITDRLAVNAEKSRRLISQNGVKFHTVCERCNSLLGYECDCELINFSNALGNCVRSSLDLPPVISISVCPQRIMRSVLGHISAQGIGRYEKGDITEPLRDYILDQHAPLPDGVDVYCWLYPYRTQVVARDCGHLYVPTGKTYIVWLLKFFPIAFAVVFDAAGEYGFYAHNLAKYRYFGIDETVNLPMVMRDIKPQTWLEEPTKTEVVFYGKEAEYANMRFLKQSMSLVQRV